MRKVLIISLKKNTIENIEFTGICIKNINDLLTSETLTILNIKLASY